jgi:hypothetical protein
MFPLPIPEVTGMLSLRHNCQTEKSSLLKQNNFTKQLWIKFFARIFKKCTYMHEYYLPVAVLDVIRKYKRNLNKLLHEVWRFFITNSLITQIPNHLWEYCNLTYTERSAWLNSLQMWILCHFKIKVVQLQTWLSYKLKALYVIWGWLFFRPSCCQRSALCYARLFSYMTHNLINWSIN